MREKISRLAKGQFDYEDPEIDIPGGDLALEAASGDVCRGSFEVRSLNHVQMRAMVFSSNRRMRCLTPAFAGETARVEYEFDTSAYETGDTAVGRFTILSNGGEVDVPFSVKIEAPYCESSRGHINDLDQFASLARDNWSEALGIFTSELFEKVFLHTKKNRRIYETLKKGTDDSLAMEEFLCAALRKEPVSIKVSEDVIEYMDLKDVMNGSLVIEKNNWGHVHIKVSAEGNFITVFNREITEDKFLGSFCQLEYQIYPTSGMEAEGTITLETFSQKITIPVRSCYTRARSEREERRISAARSLIGIFRNLALFECGVMTRARWLSSTRENLDGCENNSSSPIFRIMEADYLITAGREEEASEILDSLNERELRYRSAIDYIYYLYVNSRYKKDEDYTDLVRGTIRFYADGQLSDRWEPLVLLIRLDRPSGTRALQAFRRLAGLFEGGADSLMIYLEAVRMLNMEPSILREDSAFARSLFIWGVRRGVLSRETVLQYADLTLRMKDFHAQYMFSLMKVCEEYESREILEAVMHMLTLGRCTDRRYNRWYRLGVESALKTRNLYENYMASLDLSSDTDLPYAVLIYFQYDNRLPADQRAYLYRYVSRHRDRYENIFQNYNGIIRAFVLEQLGEGNVSRDMAALYDIYLKEEALSPRVLDQLPGVMFRQVLKIKSGAESVRRVIVNYEEIEHDYYYDSYGRDEVYIDLFLDDYRILFEDYSGGRHVVSVDYSLEKLMDAGRYIKACYNERPDNMQVLLNRSERALKYQMMDETSIDVYRRVLDLPDVSRPYRETVLKNLIDYYYDSYEGETLEKYLLQTDLDLLDQTSRCSIIEYYIQRGLFERAYSSVLEYGYENVRMKRVMRLCSRMIRVREFRKDDFLLEMAGYVFFGGRYDETILTYLNRYYNGPTQNLFEIWKAAADFEVPSSELEERLLCEALFANKDLGGLNAVFVSYYGTHHDARVIRAFLAMYSYRYLEDEEKAQQDIFRIMEIELEQMETARDICSLAMLKYASSGEAQPSELMTNVYEEAARFIDRGIIFPFFREFSGNAGVPSSLVDMTFVVCRTRPGRQIEIEYRPEEEKAPVRTEPVPEAVSGIYIRGFRLVPGESFRYRIFERRGEDEIDISHGSFSGDMKEIVIRSGADNVRRMIVYESEGDEKALEREMTEYDRFDEMTDRLFHLI